MFMVQNLIRINMGYRHGSRTSCGAPYQAVISSPSGGIGPRWDGQGARAARLPMHMDAVRRGSDVQGRL